MEVQATRSSQSLIPPLSYASEQIIIISSFIKPIPIVIVNIHSQPPPFIIHHHPTGFMLTPQLSLHLWKISVCSLVSSTSRGGGIIRICLSFRSRRLSPCKCLHIPGFAHIVCKYKTADTSESGKNSFLGWQDVHVDIFAILLC